MGVGLRIQLSVVTRGGADLDAQHRLRATYHRNPGRACWLPGFSFVWFWVYCLANECIKCKTGEDADYNANDEEVPIGTGSPLG